MGAALRGAVAFPSLFMRLIADRLQGVLSWIRNGSRKSVFGDNEELASNEADATAVGYGLEAYGVYGGATNLVGTRLDLDWIDSSSGVVTTDVGNGVYEIVFNGTNASVVRANMASAANNRVCCCQARLMSGSFDGVSTDYLALRDPSNVVKGEVFALDSLGNEWTDVCFHVTDADTTSNIVFRSENTQAATIQVRNMRAVDSTAPFPAFPDGSTAGATYGPDIPTITGIPWTDEGCIIQCIKADGWGHIDNPNNTYPRFFSAGGDDFRVEYRGISDPAAPNSFQYQSGANFTRITKQLEDGVTTVICADWNGISKGLRVDSLAREEYADTSARSGDIVIGNRDGVASYAANSKIITTILPYVPSDVEYEAIRARLINIMDSI